jgi:hypothetical protein
MRECLLASSWHYRFAFVPKGLHLDPHHSVNNPGWIARAKAFTGIGGGSV